MIIYLDREYVPDLEHIAPDVLRYLVQKAEEANARYGRLDNYYRGLHPVLMKKGDREESRVAVNYAKYVVDISMGYYLGEPVKYNVNHVANPDGKHSERSAVDLSPLLDCYDRQHISEVDSRIGKGIGIMGDCLELCYASTDADPYPKSAFIDARNGILVCDTTVEHNKLFALVWEKRETIARNQYYFLTVYTDRTERDYKSSDLKTAVFTPVGEVRFHWFGAVPVIAYTNNDERQGDFEQITSLIDAYNDLMSNRLTDKKKFVDALLVFFGMTLAEGDEKRLAVEKFIDGAPLDARAEYIQKTFDEASVQVLADTLVREMHKQTLTVDMSDEKFAGNSSGQALKLKLLTMNLLVRNKMRRMEHGLKERITLYNHWLQIRGKMGAVSVTDIDVVFTIACPINEQEIVQMVSQLQGVVDDETLLSQLWFIRDPKEALANIRRQKAENAKLYRSETGVWDEEEEEAAQEETRRLVGFGRDGE